MSRTLSQLVSQTYSVLNECQLASSSSGLSLLYDPGAYDDQHPCTARLVIEIAFSSIRKDRLVKPRIYASMGVPEYWIDDLTSDKVTVLRETRSVEFAR